MAEPPETQTVPADTAQPLTPTPRTPLSRSRPGGLLPAEWEATRVKGCPPASVWESRPQKASGLASHPSLGTAFLHPPPQRPRLPLILSSWLPSARRALPPRWQLGRVWGRSALSSGRLLLGRSPWQRASHLQSQQCCTWGAASSVPSPARAAVLGGTVTATTSPRQCLPPRKAGVVPQSRKTPAHPSPITQSGTWQPSQGHTVGGRGGGGGVSDGDDNGDDGDEGEAVIYNILTSCSKIF